MKKKVLISLTAMLAIVGLAFAAIPDGWTASAFWHEHGKNLMTEPETLSAEASNVAETYAKIKASCDAYEALNDDQIDALYAATWDPAKVTEDPDFPSTLFRTEPKLKAKNAEVALAAVTALVNNINAIPTDGTGITADKRSTYEGYQTSLEAWETADVLADFDALKGEGYTTLKGKITDGLLYVTAAEWVNTVNGYSTTFNATQWSTQKATVEEYQTAGKALAKQTSDVTTALALIQTWLDAYAAQEIADGQDAAKDDFYAAFEAVADKPFNKYSLVQSDLSFNTETPKAADPSEAATLTDFAYLARLNKALVTYKANRPDGWDITNDGGIEAVEVAYANRMLEEFTAMQAAVTYINNNSLYYDVTAPVSLSVTGYELENNDYAKIMQVKADLADGAETAGKKYIKNLFTSDKIDVLYVLAKTAFKTYDEAQFVKEAINQFKDDFSTILTEDNPETAEVDEAYKATADDYEATVSKKTTVRDAINEFKNDVSNWNVAEKYRNLTYGGNVVATEDAWDIESTTKTSIGSNVYNDLNTNVYPKLQILIKDAAEDKIVKDLLSQLNTIYTDNYVDPTADAYNAAAVLALKNKKTDKANANTAASNIGYKTATTKTSTNSYATTSIQYWMWDAENNVIAKCTKLTDSEDPENGADHYKHNGVTPTKSTGCWGYDLVMNKFRKTEEYKTTKKPALQAMADASAFLLAKKDLIWTTKEIEGVPTEVLDTESEGVTSALSTLATTVTGTGSGSYYKLSAGAKEYIPAPAAAAEDGSKEQVYEVLMANCAFAKSDVDAITGTITLYQGNSTAVELSTDAVNYPEQALCYTSKKALAEKIAEVPNTIAYIEEVLEGELPLNVVCLKTNTLDTKGNYTDWRATEIKLTYQKSFWFPIAINTVETISMDRKFTKKNNKASLVLPYDIQVNDLDSHLTIHYLDMVEEKEDGVNTIIDLNYKTKKSGEKLYAYMPYFISTDEPATYTISATNVKVLASKNAKSTVSKTLNHFIHPTSTSAGYFIDCSTTSTKYTLAGITLEGALMPAGDYFWNAGKWNYFVDPYTIPGGAITLHTTLRNSPYYINFRNNFEDEDETTSINEISTEHKAIDGIYTINGQKVENTNKPGFYIVNGKKVIKK